MNRVSSNSPLWFPTHFPLAVRLTGLLLITAGFGALFLIAHDWFFMGIFLALSAVPVLIAGWFFGPVAGAIWVFATQLLIALMVAPPEIYHIYFEQGGSIAFLAISMAGAITGGLSIKMMETHMLLTRRIELEESERKQRVMAEALRDISAAINSTLNLEGILDRIIETLPKVVKCDAMNIMLVEADRARVVRQVGYEKRGLVQYIEQFSLQADDGFIKSWGLNETRAIAIGDVRQEPRWKPFPETDWIQAHASLPVMLKGSLVGFINFNSATLNFFHLEDITALSGIADQAAVAIGNARTFEMTQKQVHHLALINQISSAINQPVEFGAIYKAALDSLCEAIGLDEASISLFDESKSTITITAEQLQSNSEPHLGERIDLSNTPILEWILHHKTPLVIENKPDQPVSVASNDPLGVNRFKVALFLPLIVQGEVTGIIQGGMINSSNAPQGEELELAETIANLAAIRIRQARLYKEEHDRSKELALLHTTLMEITSAKELPVLVETIVQRATWLLESPVGLFYMAYPEQRELRCMVGLNTHAAFKNSVLKYGEGAAGMAAVSKQAAIIPNYAQFANIPANERELSPFPACVLSVPVLWNNVLTGVLQVARVNPARPFTDNDASLITLLSNQAAIAIENARLYAKVQETAVTDQATGLLNRRGLFDQADREVERALRFQHPLSILMIDIDHFKLVNDSYGHPAGDEILKAVSEQFRKAVRSIDLVSRYGGEEFVVVILESGVASVRKIAERICRSVEEQPFATRAGTVRITLSIGVAELNQVEPPDFDGLIELADRALYTAKHSGRNQVAVYKPVTNTPTVADPKND